MSEENEENIRRKKDKKFLKHFDILINDKKVKILNYQIKEYKNSTEGGQVIEFISQQKFDKADTGEVVIKIDTITEKLTINGIWKSGFDSSGNHGMTYRIEKLNYEC